MTEEHSAAATFGFQAEVKQLLRLMAHSLYSNREIFLRELISNASDASDKRRFEALANPELQASPSDLAITVEVDPEKRRLSVSDHGIGMSRDEIIEQLGTIAHSGTARYLERLSQEQLQDSNLIGQFGVGFYSAFVVADRVEVRSRRADLPAAEGVLWRSDGQGEYSVEPLEKAEPGTVVTLELKDDADEFLDPHRLRALIRKYSDHIGFPIRLRSLSDKQGEEAEAEGDGAETVNQATALWTRPRTEISDEEYKEFYKHIAHDFSDPLTWSHNKVEGKREYTSLLYIPSTAPFDLWNRESPKGVKLYVQRVFITDHATQFLPLYLRFVRGVVDAADLSLNVSRELLQQDAAVSAIRGALTKRVLDMLAKLAAEEPDKYAVFWKQFGFVLKEGLAEDPGNRDKIAGLLRFNTTKSQGLEQDRGLADYLADLAPDQDVIYYLIAESPSAARSSPHLEAFRERGIEVLLLSDQLDEWVMQYLTEFEGKNFKDVGRGQVELPGEARADSVQTEPDKEHKHLLKRVKRVLRERVEEVRFSTRLKESAACIVLGEQDLGYQMRELLKAAGQAPPEPKPTLELNASHPLIERLEAETDEGRFERLAGVILDEAILAEGRQLDDPAGFVKRLNELLVEPGKGRVEPAADGAASG